MATKIPKSMLILEGLTIIPSVKDYGAKGDGVTDDTAAFVAFLADVQVGFVPPGNYKLTGQIKPRSDQYIYGCGKASRLIYAGPNSGTFIFFDAVSRSSLKELQIQIPYADYTSVSGITASSCSEIEIEGIRFNGGGYHPILFNACSFSKAINNFIMGGYRATGIQVNGSADCNIDGNVIRCDNKGWYGIQLNGGNYNTACHNKIDLTPDNYFGIHSYGCSFSDVSFNVVKNTRREALAVGGACIGCKVTHNHVSWNINLGTGDFGISLAGDSASAICSDFLVHGNIITNCAFDGIGIAGYTQRGVISANVIRDACWANAGGFHAGIKLYGWIAGGMTEYMHIIGNIVSRVASPGLVYIVNEVSELGSVSNNTVSDNKKFNLAGNVVLTAGTSVDRNNG